MPVNVLAPRVQVPSIAKAARNALSMRQAQETISGTGTGNLLAEKQLSNYDEDRETKAKNQELQNEARAVSTALKAGNTEQATQIYKSLGGKSDMGVTIIGDDVSIDYGVSTIKGPSGPVAELMEQVSNDPTWMTDPAKAAQTRAWMAAKGISLEQKEVKPVKQTPAEILKDKKELKRFEAGLKAKGAEGAKPPKKAAALKRISDISKAIATLEKTDTITQLLAKDNPELAQYIGQTLDPDKKAALMDAWDNELDYLEKFSGTTRKKEKGREPGEYNFTLEGGMQPVVK